jgi:hypothetical protein
MYNGKNPHPINNFPDPLASYEAKQSKDYGLQYAKSIETQWGRPEDEGSLFRRRLKEFEQNRDYANGTQDTAIYKQILNSLDPNNGDGTLLNIDWSPVPIVPKFVKIVVNKILSRNPYPNIEAVDPLSVSEKEKKKAEVKAGVELKGLLSELEGVGVKTGYDVESLPDSVEEAEIFLDTNIKIASEIATQIATELTLTWNEFGERIYRRCVDDLVSIGMAVVKRENDPNYGIVENYVDPAYFIHSYTEDPNMSDLIYAGHVRRMSIMDLKRQAGDQFTEEEYQKLATMVQYQYNNNSSRLTQSYYDKNLQSVAYGYDEFIVEILEFEFLSVDDVYFEEKESRFGNVGFYYKGFKYEPPRESVYDRKPYRMQTATVYGGKYVIGTNFLYDYGVKKNIPRNVHDLTRARLSYSVVATNLRRMIPKSMVSMVKSFADQLQITHLKIQQAIAKAKPDGLMIDIEGLENVQLGRGGELQPLDIQDIYEQTGVFYYRSKNPEGGFQNPPVREINNQIRNINELIALYNHYLRMIRDATGLNEVVDGSTPKGEQLVGVRQQAIEASNNATYDITNAAMVLFKKVCDDIVRCLQIIPKESVLYRTYEKALGSSSMDIISSFAELPMYNFGVRVVAEMEDMDKAYLEANIQQSLLQKEIDLEDAIAIRKLKDVNQAEQLLIVRRKKRLKQQQQMAQQNSQMQAQANAQVAQATSQAKMQEEQMKAQLEAQKMQMEGQMKAQLLQIEYDLKMKLADLQGRYDLQQQEIESGVRNELETEREDRKDSRVTKQAVEQSKLISQRKGERGELQEPMEDPVKMLLNQ